MLLLLSSLIACSQDDETRQNENKFEQNEVENDEYNNETNKNNEHTEHMNDRHEHHEETKLIERSKSSDDQAYMEEKLNHSFFREIEVEIKYANSLDYEFEIESDDGRIKAKLENELEQLEIKGLEAFDFIYDRVDPLNLTKSEGFDSISEKIIKAFQLPTDYTKMEVKIKFHDGSEIEFEAASD